MIAAGSSGSDVDTILPEGAGELLNSWAVSAVDRGDNMAESSNNVDAFVGDDVDIAAPYVAVCSY